jgi:hypothetical protein
MTLDEYIKYSKKNGKWIPFSIFPLCSAVINGFCLTCYDLGDITYCGIKLAFIFLILGLGSFFLLFAIVIIGHYIDNKYGLSCPYCKATIATPQFFHIVIASKCCPMCGKKIIECEQKKF